MNAMMRTRRSAASRWARRLSAACRPGGPEHLTWNEGGVGTTPGLARVAWCSALSSTSSPLPHPLRKLKIRPHCPSPRPGTRTVPGPGPVPAPYPPRRITRPQDPSHVPVPSIPSTPHVPIAVPCHRPVPLPVPTRHYPPVPGPSPRARTPGPVPPRTHRSPYPAHCRTRCRPGPDTQYGPAPGPSRTVVPARTVTRCPVMPVPGGWLRFLATANLRLGPGGDGGPVPGRPRPA